MDLKNRVVDSSEEKNKNPPLITLGSHFQKRLLERHSETRRTRARYHKYPEEREVEAVYLGPGLHHAFPEEHVQDPDEQTMSRVVWASWSEHLFTRRF